MTTDPPPLIDGSSRVVITRATLAFDYDNEGPTLAAAERGVHAGHRVDGLTFDMPLCWAWDGVCRGATPQEWEVSDDHAALPAVWLVPVPANRDNVTCPECLELVHA